MTNNLQHTSLIQDIPNKNNKKYKLLFLAVIIRMMIIVIILILICICLLLPRQISSFLFRNTITTTGNLSVFEGHVPFICHGPAGPSLASASFPSPLSVCQASARTDLHIKLQQHCQRLPSGWSSGRLCGP